MRSYTNSDQMKVEVTEAHLEAAVEIKIQLQEMSPSRRTAWQKHKQMMMAEGFEDSDVNEAYRCLIKDYQKEIGKLSAVTKYADMVATSKLEAVKAAVGDMYQEKRETQLVVSQLNKVKKELSLAAMITEEIRNVFIDDTVFNIPHYAYSPKLDPKKNKAIVVITDWHIGAEVHGVKGNYYNLEIAKKRIAKLLEKVMHFAYAFHVSDVTVVFNGDAIEHLSMRNINQAFETEFTMAQQINQATKLISGFLINLSEYFNVGFGAVGGNHDRMNGNKHDAVKGDNAVAVIQENIETIIEIMKLPRLTYFKNEEDNDSFAKEFNGSWIKFVHGDKENLANKNKLKEHEDLDNREYKAIVMGHFHRFMAIERNFGKFEIYFNSLMGANNYGKDHFKGVNYAGQGMIIVDEEGEIVPIPISLQII